ncbi:translation elongation factor Ts [Thiohalophilus thiocyanatoxydans]|uniref:Elongation factor Ts n=1 Tax=Thiohalophilus thiocyanatoxydans TaxID=381308 RepID=A0A4R8IJA4_9GAMM|nr:translation elongation factor Ts [Thiohalophilus thiocyanatoxydans]TDY00114.1 translation elongation factor Ts (EF-Ts) [Thiohalophilus thiocyanatoxydans]
MAITAAMVKELRERTGAGMMECKKALVETDGDLEAAVEQMRKSGMAKADKKAGRTAAEGLVAIKVTPDNKTAAIVEVNCETDFVTKGEDFQNLVNNVADRVLADKPADLDALMAMPISDNDSTSIEDTRKELIAKIGENMAVRRFEVIEAQGTLSYYMHGSRIGVVIDLEGGDEQLGKDLAMHIAASSPVCVSEENVPADVIQKEKEIFSSQAAESGKPADIIEKMVEGRIKKFLKEVTLLGQPFVKDADQTVEQLLKSAGATVHRFVRFEVGEGIEKKQENFAEEVMAQAKN